MSITINFDDLAVGTLVSTQYDSSALIEFTRNHVGNLGTVEKDPQAPSGPNVLQAGYNGGAVEFPDWSIQGSFLLANHSTLSLSLSSFDVITVTVYDGTNGQIGQQTYNINSTGFGPYVQADFTSGNANIASFVVEGTGSRPFSIDNLTFDDTREAQQPDFQLLYAGGVITMPPGTHAVTSITINRLHGSAGPINLKALNLPAAVEMVSFDPNPADGGNGAMISVALQSGPWSASNPVVTGLNIQISGLPSSTSAGFMDRFVKIPVTILEPYDVQIVGMEVTQAVQPFKLTQKTNPDVVEFLRFDGLPLAEGGMTRVRVFCSWKARGRIDPSFEITLTGSRNQNDLPGGPLSSVSGTSPVTVTADVVTPELRQHSTADFILPQEWTQGTINLFAEIKEGITLGTLPSTFDTNPANNIFILTDVPFGRMASLEIDPISLFVWQDGTPIFPGSNSITFNDAINVKPIAPDLVKLYDYGNMIDISDIVHDSSLSDTARAAKCRSRLKKMADQWNEKPYWWKFVIGVFNEQFGPQVRSQTDPGKGHKKFAIVQDSQRPLTSVAHEMGHLAGRIHAGLGENPVEPGIDWPPDGSGQINSVGVDSRDGSVRYPGGDPTAPAGGLFWDYMSYGLQTWLDSLPLDEWEHTFWTSVRGWIEEFAYYWQAPPRILDIRSPQLNAEAETMATEELLRLQNRAHEMRHAFERHLQTVGKAKSLIAVHVLVDHKMKAQILDVYPLQDDYPLIGSGSDYTIVLKTRSGAVTKSIHPEHLLGLDARPLASRETPSGGFLLAANIPVESYEDVGAVEVHHHESMVATRICPEHVPEIAHLRVTAEQETEDSNGIYAVSWASHHPAGLPVSVEIDLLLPISHPRGAVWHNIYAGHISEHISGRIPIPQHFLPFNPRTQFKMRISDGFNETSRISEEFSSKGTPPRVRIACPANSARFAERAHVYLRAEAYDDLRRPIGGANDICKHDKCIWKAKGVVIGRGRIISWVPGSELCGDVPVTIRCEAIDYRGRTGSDEIELRIHRRFGPDLRAVRVEG